MSIAKDPTDGSATSLWKTQSKASVAARERETNSTSLMLIGREILLYEFSVSTGLLHSGSVGLGAFSNTVRHRPGYFFSVIWRNASRSGMLHEYDEFSVPETLTKSRRKNIFIWREWRPVWVVLWTACPGIRIRYNINRTPSSRLLQSLEGATLVTHIRRRRLRKRLTWIKSLQDYTSVVVTSIDK